MELGLLYNNLDLVMEVKKSRLQWQGHMERMKEDRLMMKRLANDAVFQVIGNIETQNKTKQRLIEGERDLKKI